MSLDKAMKNLKYDTRLAEYNLNNGLITKQELEKHLATLPDDSSKSEPLKIEEKDNSNEQH